MSRVEDLIQTLCPDGVEYVTLGDISIIDSSGVDKKIVSGEKIIFLLNYMDVYRNSFIDKSVITMQVTASDKKIASCDIQQGDIFITPTSETIEDLAHSAVAIETIEEAVYSYHIMRIRLKKKSMITSYYLNYLFRSEFLQNQIMHYASGLTRFGLSRAKWLSLIIPLPPLPVQEEIVRILDTFSGVVTELEAEQAARARQYEHYRNELMSFESKSKIMENLLADFCPDGVEYLELQQIFDYRNGYTPSRNEDENWNDGTISWFTLKDLRKNGGILSESIEKITSKGVKRELFEANSIIISTLATIGEHALILNNALANQQMTCLTRK